MAQKNRTSTRRRIARGALILAIAASPLTRTDRGASHADGLADEAQLHFELGAERYQARDFRGALEHWLLSNRLVPNRNVVFNIARAYEQLQRYADAHRYYVDALQTETREGTRREIQEGLSRLAANVAVLRVETTPPGATIYLDRRDLGSRGTSPRPLAVQPGRYRVIAALDGYEDAEAPNIEARNGAEAPVRLTLTRIVGTVRVEGEAGAVVRLGDERGDPQCVAPCELRLPPGPQTVFLTREGYQPAVRQLNVVARQTVTTRATLSPLTGSLVVSADERDALVEVDGRSLGFTPAVIPNVPVGRRRVRISLRGYNTVEREIEVRANQESELRDLRLAPEREVTAASRVAEDIDDAPSSVSIISPQELQAFAYPTLAESLRGIRGITLTYDGIYSSISIRGLGQPDDYGNRLLTLQDGLVLNDALLYSSYVGYDGRTDLHDLERIEIVRGPGSVLYGTGAMSGVVNMVTRRRDLPTSGHVGFGTQDHGVARARGGFNLNLGPNAGVWMSLAGARSEGRDVNLELPTEDGMGTQIRTAAQADSFWSGTFNSRAWWGPLTFQLFHTAREQAIPHGGWGTLFNDNRTRATDIRTAMELRFEPRFGSTVQLMTRLYGNWYHYLADLAFSEVPETPARENYDITWFGGEARVILTPTRSMRISAGVDAMATTTSAMYGEDNDVDPMTMAPIRTPYLNEPSRNFSIIGAYGVFEMQATNWFRFSAAARFDYNSLLTQQTPDALSPRLALIFRPWNRGVLKVMGGRAFRAPSVYQLYYNDGGITTAVSPGLTPETNWSGEVELSHRITDDWVVLGSGYANYYQNLIETRGEGNEMSPIQYVNSTQPVVTAGGDVEIRREWRQGWMLSAMYGYLYARYLPNENTTAMTNLRVVNAPEHFASFRAVAPIIPGAMSVATRLTLEAPRRLSLNTDATTNAAVVADLVLSGNIARFGVRYNVGLYNLFDWRYVNPVSDTFQSPSYPQQGRTFMANLIITLDAAMIRGLGSGGTDSSSSSSTARTSSTTTSSTTTTTTASNTPSAAVAPASSTNAATSTAASGTPGGSPVQAP